MQLSSASVAQFQPRHEQEIKRQMRHSVYLEQLAECLYETAVLTDQLPLLEGADAPWDRLPDKARYRFEAEGALRRLQPSKRYEAQLRAREQVAASHYGRDFSRLTPREQRQIAAIVQTTVETYSRVLEGFFQSLPGFRALELEPTEGEQ